jgi:hypothetical protein
VAQPLNPTLVYLRHQSIEDALLRIAETRSPWWLDWFTKWTSERPYAKKRGLKGIRGAITYWQAYQDLTDELYSIHETPKVAIETSAGEWPRYRRTILDLLDLRETPDPALTDEQAGRLVGVYQDQAAIWKPRHGAERIEVALEEKELVIYGLWWYRARLIPITETALHVEGICLDLQFETDERGSVREMIVGGKEVGAILGSRFKKTEQMS